MSQQTRQFEQGYLKILENNTLCFGECEYIGATDILKKLITY